MKITLINPPVKEIVEAWDKPNHPHMSLGYLAGYLEYKDIPVKIIDAKLERLTCDQVAEKCLGEFLIGITSFTHEIANAVELAEKIKDVNPNAKIIIGGVHATALPEETMNSFKIFDYLVMGEGEETLYELVIALKHGTDLGNIKGIIYRKDDNIVVNEPRIGVQDLDKLPFPAWHLFPKTKNYCIMTARGCPFQCIFCMRAHGQKVRNRSVENVVKELQMLADFYKPKYVEFLDETFTLRQDRAIAICDEMIKRGLHKKIKWGAETRVNCITQKTLYKMKEAGCDMVRFGIESGNPEILKICKKGITIDQAKKAIEMAKKAKLQTQGLFIIGHPYETKKTMKDTVDLAVKLNTSIVAFGVMTPYPGTEVYNIAKAGKGNYRLLSTDWKDFNKQLGNALELKNVSRKEMEKIQFWGYMKFYFYNFKIKEIIKNFLENRKLVLKIMGKIINN